MAREDVQWRDPNEKWQARCDSLEDFETSDGRLLHPHGVHIQEIENHRR